jgi:hypothetical protein
MSQSIEALIFQPDNAMQISAFRDASLGVSAGVAVLS